MGWKNVDSIDCGEVVIRIKQAGAVLPIKFLGLSVHQIASVTNEGDIYCLGEKLKPEWIEGWLELPPPNWAKQYSFRGVRFAVGKDLTSPEVVALLRENALCCRIAELEEALRQTRTPFASTLNNHDALERLREINRLTYAVLGDGGQ